MRAVEVYIPGERRSAFELDTTSASVTRLLKALALCNDAGRGEGGELLGDPTEIALWRIAADGGFDRQTMERAASRCLELPFDRKRMTTFHRDRTGFIAYTKGAPETVLDRCVTVMEDKGRAAVDHARLLAVAEAMASDGRRVLAVAYRRWNELPGDCDPENLEQDLTLLCLVGLVDLPRPETKQAVAICKSASITPVMVTGDHPATARAIAAELGMLGDGDVVLTGRELRLLPDTQLVERIGISASMLESTPNRRSGLSRLYMLAASLSR